MKTNRRLAGTARPAQTTSQFPDAIRVGDRIMHDGAARLVSKILDCGGYFRFEFTPAWGYKRAPKNEHVLLWVV
jgi:hypothetical protein